MFLTTKREPPMSASNKTPVLRNARAAAGKYSDTASTMFSLPVDSHVLDGFVDPENAVQMRQIYRDLYFHDPICGTCVDIYSTLPFSNFSLTGLPDREMLVKHVDTCEALRVKTLFQALTIDQLVEGAPCGALSYNERKKIIDGYLPFNPDYVEFKWNPMFGQRPLMDVKLGDETRRIFRDTSDPRVTAILSKLPESLKALFSGGEKVRLEPMSSVYIPRAQRLGHRPEGLSLFRRIVPIWLIEKTLMRGTIEMAHRRQRGIMVVTAGDMDWIASQEELSKIGYDIIMADRDPLGAVLVTRPGLNFQEIKSPTDSWRHTDVVDVYTTLKLRGLGFSESLLSSEMNVNSTDASMTAMISGLRNHRDSLVRSFLYEQVFPAVSIANGFRKEDRYMETGAEVDVLSQMRELEFYNGNRVFRRGGRYMAVADGQLRDFDGEDPTHFYCPTLNWHESLRSELSTDYLDVLDRMEQKNIPVALRTYMAAGGLTVGDMMASMEEDLELRKAVNDHMKKLKKFMPQPPDDGGGGGFDRSALHDLAKVIDVVSSASADRPSFEDRADAMGEAYDADMFKRNGGKLTTLKGRNLLNDRANAVIAEASVRQAERINHAVKKAGAKGRPLRRGPQK